MGQNIGKNTYKQQEKIKSVRKKGKYRKKELYEETETTNRSNKINKTLVDKSVMFVVTDGGLKRYIAQTTNTEFKKLQNISKIKESIVTKEQTVTNVTKQILEKRTNAINIATGWLGRKNKFP